MLRSWPKYSGGGGDEAALAQDGLQQDRRHLVGVHVVLEELLLEVLLPAAHAAGGLLQAPGAAVAIGVLRPEYARQGHGPQLVLVGQHLGGQAHGQQGAAVEGALEADHPQAAGGVAGDLNRVLHRLGPGVGEHGHLLAPAGGQGVELFGQVHVGLVHGDVEAAVQIFVRLLLYGRYHLGVAVADVVYADASGEVDVFPAVLIPDQGAFGLGHGHRGDRAHSLGHLAELALRET